MPTEYLDNCEDVEFTPRTYRSMFTISEDDLLPTIVIGHSRAIERMSKVIEDRLNREVYDRMNSGESLSNIMNTQMRFIKNDSICGKKKTGRYIHEGYIMDRDEVYVEGAFCSYGPEDISWLLYAGIIEEEYEDVLYVAKSNLKSYFNPIIPRILNV